MFMGFYGLAEKKREGERTLCMVKGSGYVP